MFVARNLRTAGAILSKQVGSQARLPCCLVTWIKRDQQRR